MSFSKEWSVQGRKARMIIFFFLRHSRIRGKQRNAFRCNFKLRNNCIQKKFLKVTNFRDLIIMSFNVTLIFFFVSWFVDHNIKERLEYLFNASVDMQKKILWVNLYILFSSYLCSCVY